jgi:hypothetical protein
VVILVQAVETFKSSYTLVNMDNNFSFVSYKERIRLHILHRISWKVQKSTRVVIIIMNSNLPSNLSDKNTE